MAKGYTDALKVAEYLGRALTNDEFAHATELVAPVEVYIDRVTGRSWLDPTPTADEAHAVYGPHVYLTRRPVLTVESVSVAYAAWGTPSVLTASQFALVDAARGLVVLATPFSGYAWVSYTHAGPPLPADVALAATMLCAHWLGGAAGGAGAASGVGADVRSYTVGQELSVTRFENAYAAAGAVPGEVDALLAGYRSAKLVFA